VYLNEESVWGRGITQGGDETLPYNHSLRSSLRILHYDSMIVKLLQRMFLGLSYFPLLLYSYPYA